MKKNSLLKKAAVLLAMIMVLASMAIAVSADETFNIEDWSYWDGVSVDVTPFEGKDPAVDYDPEKGHTPIVIETAAQLAGLAKVVNESGQTGGMKGAYRWWPIYITKNIDLDGYQFTPIGWGYNTAAFGACLEGRLNGEEGKPITIKNLFIMQSSKVNVPGQTATEAVNNAFIPTLRAGSVKNLTFENAKVGHPNSVGDVAIVIGYASKETKEISGITVKNSTVITGYGSVCCGGVVANLKNEKVDVLKDIRAENVNFVTRITEDGEYAIESNIGGIVGKWNAQLPLTFENCYYSGKNMQLDTWGTIEADMYAGGFIGTIEGGKDVAFKNCQYDGQLAYAGENREASISAFIGYLGGGNVSFENCSVTGTADALVGTDGTVNATITNTTATSNVAVAKGAAADSVVTGEITYNIPEPEPTDPQPTDPEPTQPVDPQPSEPQGGDEEPAPNGIQAWVVIVVGIVCLAAGAGIGLVIKKKQ